VLDESMEVKELEPDDDLPEVEELSFDTGNDTSSEEGKTDDIPSFMKSDDQHGDEIDIGNVEDIDQLDVVEDAIENEEIDDEMISLESAELDDLSDEADLLEISEEFDTFEMDSSQNKSEMENEQMALEMEEDDFSSTSDPSILESERSTKQVVEGSIENEGLSMVGQNLLLSLKHELSVEIGKARLKGEDITNLTYGSIIELNKSIGDSVDIVLDEKMIARGEVVQINNERLGVRITGINF
jgi:flagellar motor switch protein FliN/FliY